MTPARRQPSWMTMDPSELGKAGAQSLHITCQECLIPHLNYRISTCPSCALPYCTDHLFKDYHHCAQRQREANSANASTSSHPRTQPTPSTTKPTVYTHETQCTALTCKKMIDPNRGTGGKCEACNQLFCWSHQKDFAHDCKPPPNPVAAAAQSRGLAAFKLFKMRNASKKAEAKGGAAGKSTAPAPQQKGVSRFVPAALRGSGPTVASGAVAMRELREKAKGAAGVPEGERVYVYVTAQAPRSTLSTPAAGGVRAEPKPIELSACFHADWKVAKVLDKALGYAGLENRNNRTAEAEEKWDVLLLGEERSKVLERNERFGDVVKSGERIVLMKGIGPVGG